MLINTQQHRLVVREEAVDAAHIVIESHVRFESLTVVAAELRGNGGNIVEFEPLTWRRRRATAQKYCGERETGGEHGGGSCPP